ncbi:MAG: hypothetical protein KDI61_09885, partial [Alphaproteobacteria bacterium]|nr:hypothetical protein [Alphaproteobacteria bacterium]
MSEKRSTASTLAALGLAGLLTISPGVADSTGNAAQAQDLPEATELVASINHSTLAPDTVAAPEIVPGQGVEAVATPIRIADFTGNLRKKDGTPYTEAEKVIVARAVAFASSRQNRIAIISYLDQETTLAIHRIATEFSRSPHNLPITMIVRSPVNATTPSPYGFTVVLDGVPFPDLEVPENTYTRQEILTAMMEGIQRDHFAQRASIATAAMLAQT